MASDNSPQDRIVIRPEDLSSPPVDGKTSSPICSICQCPVEPHDEVTKCNACGLPFHQECWEENQGCAAYGCRNVDALRQEPDTHWFIRLNEEEVGPLSAQELQQLAKQHIVVADTSVSVDGRNWQAAKTVKDLQLINDSRDSHTSVNSTKSVLPSIVTSKSFTAIGKKHDQKITRRENLMSGLAWIGGLIMGTIGLIRFLNRFWRQ